MVSPQRAARSRGRDGSAQPASLMVLGTASHVGKSLLVVALCRWLHRRGVEVAPFKAQNISLNSYVTPEGAEIGWAQAQQALAAGVPAHADMNPVLLKPGAARSVQFVIHGRVSSSVASLPAERRHTALRHAVLDSYRRLSSRREVLVIEGSGSAAELNLRARDVSNLWLARAVRAPCLLIADIERGGVFASLLGTLSLLTPAERRLVVGFVVNKLHGDPARFTDGVRIIEERSGKRCIGVIPYLPDVRLTEEDSVGLDRLTSHAEGSARVVTIGVVRLPHIANHTDFEPLSREPDVHLVLVDRPEDVSGLDLLVLPGTRATIADLAWLRERGLADALSQYHRNAGRIAGICGGMQMLGETIEDPHGAEGPAGESVSGLGFLPLRTIMAPHKTTTRVTAVFAGVLAGLGELRGYEVHMGRTERTDPRCPPLLLLQREPGGDPVQDGTCSSDGRVFGTYLHGLFDNEPFRRELLNTLRRERGAAPGSHLGPSLSGGVEAEIDRWTDHVMRHLDEAYLSRCLWADR